MNEHNHDEAIHEVIAERSEAVHEVTLGLSSTEGAYRNPRSHNLHEKFLNSLRENI